MKTLNFIIFLFAIFLFNACQKDELTSTLQTDSSRKFTKTEFRSYNQEDCGFIDKFCEQKEFRVISYDEPIEPCPDGCFTGGNGAVSSLKIMPVKIIDGSIAVYIDDGTEQYFVTNSEYEAFDDFIEQLPVPQQITKLLEVNYRDIEDKTKVYEDILGHSSINATLDENGNLFLDYSIGGDVVSGKVKYCDYYRASDVESFLTVFFDETVDQSHIRGFIIDAFEEAETSCPTNFSGSDLEACRYDCVDPRCIVDYLLDVNAGLSDYQKNVLVARYLGEAIGLTEEEINWLSLPSNNTVLMDVYNQLGSELSLGECENEDCSMSYSSQTIIGLEMDGQTSTMTNAEQYEFYANLFCCDEPELLEEVEDVKLNGYPNIATDAILEDMSNMCCGDNPMTTTEFANLLATQIEAELASINESWPSSVDFFDDDFWDIMYEMLKEVVPELIPGVDTYLELKSAMEAYDNGSYWQSAQHFALALLTVTPADKCKDFVKVFKSGRKGFKIFRLFDKIKSLSPELADGFKKTVLDRNKMDKHIFVKKHNLRGVTKKVGGKENLIFEIYKKIHDQGLLQTFPDNVPVEFTLNIQGYNVTVRGIKTNGTFRIGTVFVPTA